MITLTNQGPLFSRSVSAISESTIVYVVLSNTSSEISFSIGRPDTLGADAYHNRQLPIVRGCSSVQLPQQNVMLEPPHCAIIGCMVEFSRITKSVCQKVYLSDQSVSQLMDMIAQIEECLEQWLQRLPETIRPSITKPARQQSSLRRARDAQWVKRQRLVLNIRYHNLRILLFGSLLLKTNNSEHSSIPGSENIIMKCLDSAKETINIIYHVYEHSDFFQTWSVYLHWTIFSLSMSPAKSKQVLQYDIHSFRGISHLALYFQKLLATGRGQIMHTSCEPCHRDP